MAKSNQIFENKTFGDIAKVLVSGEDSMGELLRAQVWVKKGAVGPPEHYHPIQSESFEVVSGMLNLKHNGKSLILNAGEKFVVEPNNLHTWYNQGNDDLVMIVELKPALKTEFFLESVYSLDYLGKVDKKGMPGFLQFAAILNEYYGEIFMVNPPIIIQKFIAKVVGGFAKLIGYKGYIPFPQPINKKV
ncbi:MAG TPA: cupin domain-containing protein [Anditalea sp.]|nr:cupin domain-containing protein [Anditalea sp.]